MILDLSVFLAMEPVIADIVLLNVRAELYLRFVRRRIIVSCRIFDTMDVNFAVQTFVCWNLKMWWFDCYVKFSITVPCIWIVYCSMFYVHWSKVISSASGHFLGYNNLRIGVFNFVSFGSRGRLYIDCSSYSHHFQSFEFVPIKDCMLTK